MNNTELKALVEKCNAYIASKFTAIRHPRVKMDTIIEKAIKAQDGWTPAAGYTHNDPYEWCPCTHDVFNYYNKDEAIAKIQSLTDLHFNVFKGEQTLEAQVALQVAEVEKLFA